MIYDYTKIQDGWAESPPMQIWFRRGNENGLCKSDPNEWYFTYPHIFNLIPIKVNHGDEFLITNTCQLMFTGTIFIHSATDYSLPRYGEKKFLDIKIIRV